MTKKEIINSKDEKVSDTKQQKKNSEKNDEKKNHSSPLPESSWSVFKQW